MDVGAIILVGGLGDSPERDHESFAGWPLATHDVLGKPVLWRVVERLKAQSVSAISMISEGPMPEGAPRPPLAPQPAQKRRAPGSAALPWTEACSSQFWRAAENAFAEMAQSGAEAVLVIRMGGYAEFEIDDFLQRHLDGRGHVTGAVDANGSPLDMFMINASRRNDAAYLFRHHLRETRAECENWVFRGYHNPLANARDLRALAVDGLMQRAQLKPVGEEYRPGVWVARRAQIDRGARVLAPAYIAEHARIRANAVITRCGAVEHHAEVDAGTVIENSTVLPYTYVGPGLDIAHAVAGGRKLAHLPRNVEVEIADPSLLDMRPQRARLRVLSSAASLATFLPVQFFRGLFATSHREQGAEQPAAVQTPSAAMNTPGGFEASAKASSFSANLAVARRYGDQ